MWESQYFGGIGGVVFVEGSWYHEDYNQLKFEPLEVSKGLWKGIGFRSEIITYEPTLKGLQIQHNYYTLPGSTLILYEQEIVNNSEITRFFDLQLEADLETSKTENDTYYTVVDGKIMKYNSQKIESQMWKQIDVKTRWAAGKNSKKKYFLGAVVEPLPQKQNLQPYVPNLDLISLGYKISKIRINPKEKLHFHVLYLLTEKLEEIYPFVKSNLRDTF